MFVLLAPPLDVLGDLRLSYIVARARVALAEVFAVRDVFIAIGDAGRCLVLVLVLVLRNISAESWAPPLDVLGDVRFSFIVALACVALACVATNCRTSDN